MKRILSIDWDYFFRIPPDEDDQWALYDWGGKENKLYIDGVIWVLRAADFLEHGGGLPGTTGEEAGFWDRFRFNRWCKLIVTESHADIARHIDRETSEIFNFDAHHDAYKTMQYILKNGRVTCEDWASLAVANGISVDVWYPAWRANNPDMKPKEKGLRRQLDHLNRRFRKPFDLVYVCRSGAWTPPWIDRSFFDFVDACPVGNRDVSATMRTIDLNEAKRMADAIMDFNKMAQLHLENERFNTDNHTVVPAEELRRKR